MENEVWNVAQKIRIDEMVLLAGNKSASGNKSISASIDYGDNKLIYRSKEIQNKDQINMCFNKLLTLIDLDKRPFRFKLKLYDQNNSNIVYYQESLKLTPTNYEDILKILNSILTTYEWISNNQRLQFNFNDYDYDLIRSILEIVNSRERSQYGYLTTRNMKAEKQRNGKVNRTLYYSHFLAPIYILNNNDKIINKGDNFYFSTSLNSINGHIFTIKDRTTNSYLEDYNPLKERPSILVKFPYLADYLVELQNWKYIHKVEDIPDNVINQIKQKYIKERKNKQKQF